MADESYVPGIYIEQGANRLVVKSGASLDIESGGEIDFETGSALKFNGYELETPSSDGLGTMRVARATYDFAEHGGTIGAISLGVVIPDDAVVCGGFVDVKTTATSASDAGTGAIHVQGANDIVSAIAISNGGNPWDAGLKAIVPKANTPETTGIKLTAARTITFTIAVEDFTAGKFVVFLYYLVGD